MLIRMALTWVVVAFGAALLAARFGDNPALTQNGDAGLYDLGLCERADLCGAFLVPSLRTMQ